MATFNLSSMQALSFHRLSSSHPQNTRTLSFNLHSKPSFNPRPISLKPYNSDNPRKWTVALAVKNLGETEAVVVSPENDGPAGEFHPGAGVYAVYDKDGELQFIGISRNVAASVETHRKSVPELCGSFKVRLNQYSELWIEVCEIEMVKLNAILQLDSLKFELFILIVLYGFDWGKNSLENGWFYLVSIVKPYGMEYGSLSSQSIIEGLDYN